MQTESLQDHALKRMNVHMTMQGVLQQLERLERVHEDVNRNGTQKRSRQGDSNHLTTEANLAALNAKLGCLQGILNAYDNREWRMECAKRIDSWYDQRRGNYSEVLIRAALESYSACFGLYKMRVRHTTLTAEQLQSVSQRLYQACERFHKKQDKVKSNPEAYLQEIASEEGNSVPFDPQYPVMKMQADLRAAEERKMEIEPKPGETNTQDEAYPPDSTMKMPKRGGSE